MVRIPRPVFTAERPSQTMAQIGPLSMSSMYEHILQRAYWDVGKHGLTSYKAFVEGFVGQILIMLFEMILGRCDKLHSYEFITNDKVSFRSCYRRAKKCCPKTDPRFSNLEMMSPMSPLYSNSEFLANAPRSHAAINSHSGPT